MASPQRIAIFLPNWVGDVVMATPAIRAISELLGRESVTLVGKPIALQTLYGNCWSARSIEEISREGLGGLRQMVRTLRAGRFDTIVLMPNSFRTAAVARLAGPPRLVGYNRDGRGWLLTDRLEPPRTAEGRFKPAPMLDYYNRLALAVGTADPGYRMQLPVSPPHETQAEQMLDSAGRDPSRPLVILNPGGSFGPSKMWMPDRYGRLGDRLVAEYGAQIILNVAPNEKAIARQVAAAMVCRPLINFAEQDNSLPLLGALVRRADLMVTNDTGARHFAVAGEMSVVTLFGSTDPRWTHLYYNRERCLRVELPCSPCQEKLCVMPAGPLYHKCMLDIPVDRGIAACRDLLGPAGVEGQKQCSC